MLILKRNRVPALTAAVSAATLLLGGCASGTIASLNSANTVTAPTSGTPSTSATTSAAPTDTTTADAPTTSIPTHSASAPANDPISAILGMISDPGCKEAMVALDNVYKLQSDPSKLLSQFPTMISQMRDGAKKTKKPGAKDAINKLADDFQNMLSTDQSKVETDGTAVGMACI